MRSEVLTATAMNMAIFWNTATCSLLNIDRRFTKAYCLHMQGDHRIRLHSAASQKPAIFSCLISETILREFKIIKLQKASSQQTHKCASFIYDLALCLPCFISLQVSVFTLGSFSK
jgi:hypothetical protein